MAPFFPLLRLSARHVLYYKSRYLIIALLLVFGSMILFLSLSYLVSVQASLKQGLITRLTGHLQIYDPRVKEISLYQDPTGIIPWIQNPGPMEQALGSIPHLTGLTRRILVGGLIQKRDRSMGVLIAGLEMEKEIQFRERIAPLSLSGLIRLNPQELLLGKGVARLLNAAPGETLPLLVPNESGFISGRRFLVKGVFSTPGLDPIAELFVYMNLSDLQSLLGLEKEVGHLVLFLENETYLPGLVPAIEKRLQASQVPGKLFAWDEIGKPFLGILDLSKLFLGLTNLLVMAIISLTIVNSTLMNLFERMPELGTLLMLGTKRRSLFLLLLGEFFFLGLIALLVGLFLGWLVSWIFSWWGLPALNPAMAMAFGQERLYLITSPEVWFISFGITFFFLLTSAGFPILRSCRMKLAEVLKEN